MLTATRPSGLSMDAAGATSCAWSFGAERTIAMNRHEAAYFKNDMPFTAVEGWGALSAEMTNRPKDHQLERIRQIRTNMKRFKSKITECGWNCHNSLRGLGHDVRFVWNRSVRSTRLVVRTEDDGRSARSTAKLRPPCLVVNRQDGRR